MNCPKCDGLANWVESDEPGYDMIIFEICNECSFEFTSYYKLQSWKEGKHVEEEEEIEQEGMIKYREPCKHCRSRTDYHEIWCRYADTTKC